MNELQLKYGCNPNQKPSRIFMENDRELPITVLSGRPGYINLLDALNGWQLVKELKEATGLPGGERSGSYVFLFQHGQWRYDKAERLRISASDAFYDFINDFTVTDENTIALQSPINGEETILFKKGGNADNE